MTDVFGIVSGGLGEFCGCYTLATPPKWSGLGNIPQPAERPDWGPSPTHRFWVTADWRPSGTHLPSAAVVADLQALCRELFTLFEGRSRGEERERAA